MELTLPEELLLLCTNPRTGVVKCPQYFTRVLAGGLLSELRLRGAVVPDGSMIAEVRPMSTGDAVADEVLAKIVRHVQLGWPGARQTRLTGLPTDYENAAGQSSTSGWKRRLARAGATVRTVAADGAAPSDLQTWLGFPYFDDLEQRYLRALELRGLLTSGRHRMLGVVPRTTWQAVSPDHERRTFARVDPEIRPHVHGRPATPPSTRTVTWSRSPTSRR